MWLLRSKANYASKTSGCDENDKEQQVKSNTKSTGSKTTQLDSRNNQQVSKSASKNSGSSRSQPRCTVNANTKQFSTSPEDGNLFSSPEGWGGALKMGLVRVSFRFLDLGSYATSWRETHRAYRVKKS